jgi:isocitrate dehydrogenase kinase/phosphatase
MMQGFETSNKRFEEMRTEMNKRFEQVDKRLEHMSIDTNKRFEQIDKHLTIITNRMDRFMFGSFRLNHFCGHRSH